MRSKKVKRLLEEVRKARKGSDTKFLEALENLEDEADRMVSERNERLIIFAGFLFSTIFFVTLGLVFNIKPESIIGAVSGKEQSGTFNFVPNVYSFAVICLISPFAYMLVRRFKAGKGEE